MVETNKQKKICIEEQQQQQTKKKTQEFLAHKITRKWSAKGCLCCCLLMLYVCIYICMKIEWVSERDVCYLFARKDNKIN